jgi:hypothetical protein
VEGMTEEERGPERQYRQGQLLLGTLHHPRYPAVSLHPCIPQPGSPCQTLGQGKLWREQEEAVKKKMRGGGGSKR